MTCLVDCFTANDSDALKNRLMYLNESGRTRVRNQMDSYWKKASGGDDN